MEDKTQGVRVDRVAARVEEDAQLEGRIELSSDQSDIARVIGTTATLVPDEVRVLDDALEFSGKVVFEVMVVTTDAPDDVAVIEAESRFRHTMAAPGAHPGMTTDFIGRVDSVEEVLEDPRQIALTADVHFQVWVIETMTIDPLEGAQNLELRTRDVLGVETIETKTQSVDVSEQVEIPPRALPVGQVLGNSAFAVVREVTGTPEGTHVEGDLVVFTSYFSAEGEQAASYQTTSFLLPISFDIEWDQRGEGENARVILVVDEIETSPAADEMGENRLLDVTAHIVANASLWQEKEATIPEDGYIPGHDSAIETVNIEFGLAPQTRRSQRMLRFGVTLPTGFPPIAQTLCLRVRPTVRSVAAQQDGALVVGTLECDVIYRAAQEDAPVYGFRASIPYEERIAVDCPPQNLMIRAFCEQTSCAMASETEVECRVQLDLEAFCAPSQQLRMLTNIVDRGADDAKSAIVMTVAGPSDDLWSIAKRFGVAQEEVLAANVQYRERPPKTGERVLLYRRTVD